MCKRDVEWLGMTFLNIAGAGTETEPCQLTGWPRVELIRSMLARHWRVERMQHALRIERRWYLYQVARKAGIDVTEPDLVDELSIDFVMQGCPMRLDGVTRVEAIRRLAPTHAAVAIARLVGCEDHTVRHEAAKAGITLIPAPTGDCWWSKYATTHSLAR